MVKYKITNIRWAGTRWLAEVGAWNSCICEAAANKVTVSINQTKRPNKTQIVGAFKLQLGD